jgi:hypothetical protein
MNSAGISRITRCESGSPQVTSYGSERRADYIIIVRAVRVAGSAPAFLKMLDTPPLVV